MFGGFGHEASMGAQFNGLDVADGVVKLVVISLGSVTVAAKRTCGRSCQQEKQ